MVLPVTAPGPLYFKTRAGGGGGRTHRPGPAAPGGPTLGTQTCGLCGPPVWRRVACHVWGALLTPSRGNTFLPPNREDVGLTRFYSCCACHPVTISDSAFHFGPL